MDYLLAFLEGVVTFLSPCLLPLLPVYLSYFAGNAGTGSRGKVALRALGFVLGFTIVFVALGAFAGSLGSLLREHRRAVEMIAGVIVAVFGLSVLEVVRIPWLHGRTTGLEAGEKQGFGPRCFRYGVLGKLVAVRGRILGSAMMLAASRQGMAQGVLMLLAYSVGLGIPFVASALLLGSLRSLLAEMKRHMRLINRIAGALLVAMGLLMVSGLIDRLWR